MGKDKDMQSEDMREREVVIGADGIIDVEAREVTEDLPADSAAGDAAFAEDGPKPEDIPEEAEEESEEADDSPAGGIGSVLTGGFQIGEQARLGISALISGYLIYLGVSIIKGTVQGDGGMPLWVALFFGVLFIVAAILFFVMRYKLYKQEQEQDREQEDESGQ